MKTLNVTNAQANAIADRLQYERAAASWDDYSELCYAVASDMKVDTEDVEHIYDDLFVNDSPEWVGSDDYDELDDEEDDDE